MPIDHGFSKSNPSINFHDAFRMSQGCESHLGVDVMGIARRQEHSPHTSVRPKVDDLTNHPRAQPSSPMCSVDEYVAHPSKSHLVGDHSRTGDRLTVTGHDGVEVRIINRRVDGLTTTT